MLTELYSQWQTDVSKPHHGKIDILYTQNILRQGASLGVRNSCLSVTSQNHDDKGERGYTKKSPRLCSLGLNPPKEEGGGDNLGKLRRRELFGRLRCLNVHAAFGSINFNNFVLNFHMANIKPFFCALQEYLKSAMKMMQFCCFCASQQHVTTRFWPRSRFDMQLLSSPGKRSASQP